MNEFLLTSSLCCLRSTDVSCFWCKHNCFKSSPIGLSSCVFMADKVTKVYHSEITKDKYEITENLTSTRKKRIEKLMENHKSKFSVLDNHSRYFIVDGVYCSFNCCKAFIMSVQREDFYKHSQNLLNIMYRQVFDQATTNIEIAPDWRLLNIFGGPLTIQEFRKSFNNMRFNDIDDYIIRAPNSRMIGKLYEKKVKF